MWAAVVPRVTPATRPRAYWSQCGTPRPANAGTRYTPSGSATCDANASTSDDDLMMPSPSRSHCTTAPAMKMLPSSAYSVRLPMRHATVVSRLCLDAIGLVPVFMSMKQPVPYVFFTMPGWVHAWPNSAACWSPAMPAIGTAPPNSVVSPYTSLDEPTAGNTDRGTPNSFSSSSSQSPVRRLNNIVRDALLGSVTCTRPPVKFQTSHESTVPNASLPAFALARAPGTLRSIHSSFVPEKYASTTRPVLRLMSGASPRALSRSHAAAVRRSCHTMA